MIDKESWKAYCKREDISWLTKSMKRAFRNSLGYHLFRVAFYRERFIEAFKEIISWEEKKIYIAKKIKEISWLN